MRFLVAAVFAGLLTTLLAVPAPAGCGAGYYGYPTTYYQPTYVAPTYAAPVVTSYTNPYATVVPYAVPVDTFYRVAPDLASARVAQESADAAVAKFKAELARQAADQAAAADRAADRQFKETVLQLLQRGGPAAGPDPAAADALQRLQAENAQMRAALEKIAAAQNRPPAPPSGGSGNPPPPPVPPPLTDPGPPAVPPDPRALPAGPAPAVLNSAAKPELLAKVKALVGKSCMPCHAAGNAQRLSDLEHPEALTYEQCTDCIRRMITNNPKKVMPKGKPPGTAPIDLVSAVEDLAETAPHDPRLK